MHLLLLMAILLLAGAANIGAPVDAVAGDKIPVIITFAAPTGIPIASPNERRSRRQQVALTLKRRAAASRSPMLDQLRGKGITPSRDLWIVNGVVAEIPAEMLDEIAAIPGVTGIHHDIEFDLPEISFNDVTDSEWNITAVRVPELWSLGLSGRGVVVANMDSGVDLSHSDLSANWRGGRNSWFDPFGEHPHTPFDPSGHGTQTMGIIAGGNDSGTAIGVAPAASWIAVRVFNNAGKSSTSAILAGFQWLLDPDGDPDTDDAPDVVNCSWGFEDSPGTCDPLFRLAVRNLGEAGISVIFSAGNGGPEPSTSLSPANYGESFAVGSVNRSKRVSTFSSRGPSACNGAPYPNIVAPGESVRTAHPVALGSYRIVSGTSFAAPHVAGTIALLLEAFPGTPPHLLAGILENTAEDLLSEGPDHDSGFGLLNALAAYQALAGLPHLAIQEPSTAQQDRLFAFGSVPPGDSTEGDFLFVNAGGGILRIFSVTMEDNAPPFSISNDTCSGAALVTGERCTISVRFAPSAIGSFAGRLSVHSDAESDEFLLRLTGIGNFPPPQPIPLQPADGAIFNDNAVTFEWLLHPDPDGDRVSDHLILSKFDDFPLDATIMHPLSAAGVAGGGGVAAVLLCGGAWIARRRPAIRLAIMAGAALLLLVHCGNGDGGTDPSHKVYAVAGLERHTTYYWKIIAADQHGAIAESPVRSFTIR
jgi:hypothetical protein